MDQLYLVTTRVVRKLILRLSLFTLENQFQGYYKKAAAGEAEASCSSRRGQDGAAVEAEACSSWRGSGKSGEAAVESIERQQHVRERQQQQLVRQQQVID